MSSLVTLLGAVLAGVGELISDKNKALSKKLVFSGAVLAGVGAFWSNWQQGIDQNRLQTKSEEIAELNKTLAATVTGGDSFCYLAFTSPTMNQAALTLVHNGKYPLYDVSIRIVDLEKFDLLKEKAATFEGLAQTSAILNVGNLAPSQAQLLSTGWPLPNQEQQRYNVFFSARNGFFTQLIRLRRIDGQWKQATKVFRLEIGEPSRELSLLEKVDPDFPRDESGQVEWEKTSP